VAPPATNSIHQETVIAKESFAEKVCFVTGGAMGLGEACVRAFIRAGGSVVIADVATRQGRLLADELGSRSLYVDMDVTSDEDWSRAIETSLARFGRIDVVVNNAGMTIGGSVEEMSYEAWRRVFAVNVDGVFLGCKHAIRIMKDRGGSIVNVSSSASNRVLTELDAYSASKSAVEKLTKTVALHCARRGYGIRCNSIHPGPVKTPLFDKFVNSQPDPEAAEKSHIGYVPMGRLGRPDEIANGVLFLASDEASFITGADLSVDGGHSIG
jgi:NAD(P)-dependent dehydrogenase (short-subunit alcohol dehydrogenase family)